jgi:hypothetical protein
MYESKAAFGGVGESQAKLDNEFSPQDFMKDNYNLVNVQDGRLYDTDLNPRKVNKRKQLKKESVDASNSYDSNMFEDLGSKTVIRGSVDGYEYQGSRGRHGSRSKKDRHGREGQEI